MSGTTDELRSVREFTVESPALLLLAGQERALATTHLCLRAGCIAALLLRSAYAIERALSCAPCAARLYPLVVGIYAAIPIHCCVSGYRGCQPRRSVCEITGESPAPRLPAGPAWALLRVCTCGLRGLSTAAPQLRNGACVIARAKRCAFVPAGSGCLCRCADIMVPRVSVASVFAGDSPAPLLHVDGAMGAIVYASRTQGLSTMVPILSCVHSIERVVLCWQSAVLVSAGGGLSLDA
jgi:hypothetical protein